MINRRALLARSFAWPLLYALWPRPLEASVGRVITRLAFGSCADQNQPQPVWDAIRAANPNLFIFCGDNVYADTVVHAEIEAAYEALGSIPEFARFRRDAEILATWDDHDYGADDTGSQYPEKAASKQIMLDFFGEPQASVRRSRPGVYTSYVYGPADRRVQILLLDLRWFRMPGALLGPEQWRWLEAELRKPADVRFLVSSIQLVSSEHEWEKWSQYPEDKARFLALVDRLGLTNLVVLSGDMHFGEFSLETTPGGIPLLDFTSSGLNRGEPSESIINSRRLGMYDGNNFGVIDIDWPHRQLQLELRTEQGQIALAHNLRF